MTDHNGLLLTVLPSVLLHPPTHLYHEHSVALAYNALRKITTLDRALLCKAFTGLAELGLHFGFDTPGIKDEIQQAITKASLIAQNLPSLSLYKTHLPHLSARLSLASGNAKAAQNTLKRSLSLLTSNDPPHVFYATHLALIASICSQSSDQTTNTLRSLGAIYDLHELAASRGHRNVVQLASVLRLRSLVHSGLWTEVGESLHNTEAVLDMVETLQKYADEKGKASVPTEGSTSHSSPQPSTSAKAKPSLFEYALIVHTLILGIIFRTHVGDAASVTPRLKWLHEILDLQLPQFPKTGIFEIPFTNAPPLYFQLTHPRIIYVTGFLVSSLAKRDLVGRKPKKKVFAAEGISAVDKELHKELVVPKWAFIHDVQDATCTLKRIRADLMCELVSACIMRSEFDDAERSIDELIAYTRTHDIFSSYVSRISLYEAQLAHALNQPKRALQCYQIAAWLSRKRNITNNNRQSKSFLNPTERHQQSKETDGEDDPWINAASRAGELWLRIGLIRQVSNTTSEEEKEMEMEELRKVGVGVVNDCRALGGTLEAASEVLQSCLTKEYVQAKTNLRRALNLSTEAQDNHLRALVLSLIASHYLHTSGQHAEKMLETAESLAAGLGAQAAKSKQVENNINTQQNRILEGVGNAHLRLWIGERFLELYNRNGSKEAVKGQSGKNRWLAFAVEEVEKRPSKR